MSRKKTAASATQKFAQNLRAKSLSVILTPMMVFSLLPGLASYIDQAELGDDPPISNPAGVINDTSSTSELPDEPDALAKSIDSLAADLAAPGDDALAPDDDSITKATPPATPPAAPQGESSGALSQEDAENSEGIVSADGIVALDDPVTVTFMVDGAEYAVFSEDNGYLRSEAGAYYISTAPSNPPIIPPAVSFRGWFKDGSSEPFDFNAPITESLVLSAQFSDLYLIKFKDGDGKVIFTRNLTVGTPILNPPAEVSEAAAGTAPSGSHFEYWYEEDTDGSVMFAFNTTTASEDLTLVPKFSDYWYVIFVSAGSQIDPPVSLVNDGSSAVRPADPTREGYTFSHWSTVDKGTAAFDFSTPITEDTYLYAVWSPKNNIAYTIVVWLERPNYSGTPTMGNMADYNYIGSFAMTDGVAGATKTFANEAALPATITSLFAQTAGNSSALKYATYQGSDSKEIRGNGTTVINVYATRKVYTYRFPFPTGNNGWYMTMNGNRYGNGVTNPVYQVQVKYEQDISNLFPMGADFNFGTSSTYYRYWGTTTEMNQIVENNNLQSKRLVLDARLLPASGSNASTLTFTLQTINTAPVEFRYFVERLPGDNTTPTIGYNTSTYIEMVEYRQIMQDGTYAKSISGLSAVNDGSPGRYNFSGGAYSQSSSGAIRIFFYTRNPYSFTYNSNIPDGANALSISDMPATRTLPFGSNVGYPDATSSSLAGTNPPTINPTLSGYTFKGWYKDADGKEIFDFGITMPNGPLVAYAIWESDENTVTYLEAYGGVQVDFEGVANGAYANHHPYVEGNSYIGLGIFRGWYYMYQGKPIPFNYEIPIWKDYELFAVWKTDGFKVTYDAGLGSGTVPTDIDSYELGTFTRAEQAGSGLIPPAGELFYAWLNSIDGVLYYPGNLVPVDGNLTLTAQFALESELVTITYVENYSGSTSTFVVHAIPGTVITLAGEVFTRPGTGNTLIGWNTQADKSGTDHALNEFGFIVPTSGITLYGVWDKTDFTVTYDVDGDIISIIDPDSPYNTGETVLVVGDVPSKAGYTFAGWLYDGDIYLGGDYFVMPAANVTLVAQWTQDKYTVTYAPGDHGTFTSQVTTNLVYGTTTPDAPVSVTGEPGWTFTGWSPTPTTTVTGDATYTAQWIQDQYSVAYTSGDHGTFGVVVILNLVYGVTTPEPPEVTGDLGWTFTGWDPEPTPTVTGNATYVAQWTQDKYTVTYLPGAQGTFAAQSTPNLIYGVATPAAPTVTGNLGWTFAGWSPTVASTVTATVTYTAQWTANDYHVTYNPNGATGAVFTDSSFYHVNDIVTVHGQGSFAKYGYYFYGWSENPSATVATYEAGDTFLMPAADVELYALWAPLSSIVVTFNPNGGGTPSPVSKPVTFDSPYGTLATTSRSGYTFDGWFTEATGGILVTDATIVTNASNHTLFAHWTALGYTVTFNANGGSTPNPTSKPVVFDSQYGSLATTTRSGYTFTGWYTAATGGTRVLDSTIVRIAGDHTLYARWTSNYTPPPVPQTYTVTYQPGEHGTFAPQTTSGLSYGTATPAAPAITAATGWKFVGWTPTVQATVTGSVTYTATWEQATFTVTFVDDDGTVLKTEEVVYGTDATPPTTPTREGRHFVGWDGDYTNVTSDITVKAQLEDDEKSPDPPIPEPGGWALWNLILSILGGILAIIVFAAYFFRRNKDEEDRQGQETEQSRRQKRFIWRVLSIVLAIFAFIFFFLTEDIHLIMILVDWWTIVHAIILLVQGVFTIIAIRRKTKEDDEGQQRTYSGVPAK